MKTLLLIAVSAGCMTSTSTGDGAATRPEDLDTLGGKYHCEVLLTCGTEIRQDDEFIMCFTAEKLKKARDDQAAWLVSCQTTYAGEGDCVCEATCERVGGPECLL